MMLKKIFCLFFSRSRQLANPVDDKAVLLAFTKYVQRLGHSSFKTKQVRQSLSMTSCVCVCVCMCVCDVGNGYLNYDDRMVGNGFAALFRRAARTKN